MKKNGLISLLCLVSATSTFAAAFNCSDYFGRTTLNVNYTQATSANMLVQGSFTLKSNLLPIGNVSGTFFNYRGEPDNFGLDYLDCTSFTEAGYCVEQSGKWLSAGDGKYNLTFGGVDAVVTCQGDLP